MTIQSERRGDVYFISHGGPPHMFSQESLAHAAWKKVGKYLKETNPRGIVAISAHWEGEGGKGVKVNSNTGNPLIYDFYGFPKHYYDQTFESAGTPALLDDVKSALIGSEIHVEEENRGLDHGVWVPLKIAFGGKTHIPLIQVSLPGDGKVQSSLHLGQALSSLRDRGYAIVASGQIVHNLRDLFGGAKSFPYLKPFAAATQEAIYSQNPKESITALTKHQNYKQAHPTDEHFYPLPVAIGATDESDTVEEIAFTKEDNLGWGFWRWSRAVDV